MKRADAYPIAEKLVEYFRPFCQKCEIAGSLRVGIKEEVHDLEIVALPSPDRPRLAFGQPAFLTRFDQAVYDLGQRGELVRQNAGTKYIKALVPPSMVQLDLFVVRPPAQWGPIFCIRTGPADFSHWIVTPGAGGLPRGYIVSEGAVYPGYKRDGKEEITGPALPMPEESDFLEFCRALEMTEPRTRRPKGGRHD